MSYLKISDVSVRFNDSKVLDRVNFSVEEGEILTIIGPSGCGKSTLLNVIAGLVKPMEGSTLVRDEPIESGSCAYMFQEDRLLPWRTLLENILLPDEIQGDKPIRHDLAKNYLARMGLEQFEEYYPQHLSGGMRKRAALARTFFLGKEIILFDEPLVSIDYDLALELERQIFEHVISEKRTAIIITHSYDTAAALADRIILLTKTPTCVRKEFNAGLARALGSPTKARASKEFFDLTSDILAVIQQDYGNEK